MPWYDFAFVLLLWLTVEQAKDFEEGKLNRTISYYYEMVRVDKKIWLNHTYVVRTRYKSLVLWIVIFLIHNPGVVALILWFLVLYQCFSQRPKHQVCNKETVR